MGNVKMFNKKPIPTDKLPARQNSINVWTGIFIVML